MNNPVSTYRLQFHKDFTFDDFDRILPYLQRLGVGTIYASPIFAAPSDSTHGYDGVNPHNINAVIGTEEQLRQISSRLSERNIGWLQDIVPNHMAFDPGNPWLMDVLEKGQLSYYAQFFDIAWNSELYHGRLMVPFLGSPLDEVIQQGELTVAYQEDRFVFSYFDSVYPLHLRSYATVLLADGEKNQAVQQLLVQLEQIHQIDDQDAYATRFVELRLQLASLMKNEVVNDYVNACLDIINRSPEKIKQIADEQVYRLAYWQDTDKQINFRRFFTVNGLICLNMQDPYVFEHYHEFIKQLLDEGVFRGLRVDHIDGLYDPSGYLRQLRALAGEEAYIVVEKILEPGEDLPKWWPIQGNTGYDFLAFVNNLFTQSRSESAFTELYRKLVGEEAAVHEQIHEKKAYILYEHMAGELDNLYHLFMELNLVDDETAVNPEVLKHAIGEFLIRCPVYRYYANDFPLGEEETQAVQAILASIRESEPVTTPIAVVPPATDKPLALAVDVLETVLLNKPLGGDEDYNRRVARFYQRCMQFTGPLMAKGVEDTLMYTYNRFVGHNEVGDSPEVFGISPDEFHRTMQERQKNWPLSINGTSTHDTKRGEDARARLNVLTDLAEEWVKSIPEWQKLNADLKQTDGPDANDEYFIYQTLIGTYRMPNQDDDDYANRIQQYLEKALREAKRHSNWTTPNEAYENAAKAFAVGLLDKKRPFWKTFETFHRKVADFGVVNSLSQVLLKFTCPGVPDVYQGTELWDFSLVDPDNRRAVGYDQRERWLDELEARAEDKPADLLQDLWDNRFDARIKLWLVHTLLNERKLAADLFAEGDYIPLQVAGQYKDYVMAFARKHAQQWYVTVVPLHLADLSRRQKTEIPALDWKDTRILLPDDAPAAWEHLWLKTTGTVDQGIAMQDIVGPLPLAVLKLQRQPKDRNAGVLLAVTSLPSAFGVGDVGPEAKAFAEFLSRSRQTYWQLLPLSPTEDRQGHSPYSAISSMGGNTLLISPELLAADGLIDPADLKRYQLPVQSQADFTAAERIRDELFEKAWQHYQQGKAAHLHQPFRQFCEREAAWLDDYALYVVLKLRHDKQPWFTWPDEYKLRQLDALAQVVTEAAEALNKVKWLQFLFFRQWSDLKTYCNNLGIRIFGDLPFYVSYDSVDVWSNPDIFCLDDEGNMTGVAGVPPDYFSEDGQLWGMPTYRWDVLKARQYDWWINRVRKNLELYDVVRLDHFRAFADFWEVPAGEKTARNGQWKRGPRAEFFQVLLDEIGDLPFIAEDLGDIDEPVYELRDMFAFPGMRVLQFAFGDTMPESLYIPHNFTTPTCIAYTGTHDNNTTRGWFKENAKAYRKQLEQYTGLSVTEKTSHLVLARLAYGSIAQTAILPIQDVLGLDETARLNTPGSSEHNWLWRLTPGQLTTAAEQQLRQWTELYNR
ncbi:malto-oligosyltrehalose synthase [Fibrisoma montanum]|uniref:4-alpha-glucanotransferase n=1 Tax=Fibrisoma montanum TaxID=2305895 RepID=A0A418MBY6_9BACT|nr:malto-oligosyltrehalose synthase [Fibrisoma montanum]RIV23879.1 malto-oligosyltrehalose synthase [Fibrisoma montanum]